MGRSRVLKLYEFVSDVVECGVESIVAELGIEPERARELMMQVAKAICDRNAKSTVYIPEAINLKNMTRNAGIWAEYQQDGPAPTFHRKFTPGRAAELAALHNLSRQQLYSIIAAQREDEIDESQGKIPGLEEVENG